MSESVGSERKQREQATSVACCIILMCYDKLTPPPRINLRIGESSGMLQPDRVSLLRRKLKMLGLEKQ